MSMKFTTAPIKQALTYPFQDEKWQSKLLIGLLVLILGVFIPIVPALVLYGYLYQIMERVLVGDGELHLPDWNDWGQHLGEGWRLFCVYFLYLLPAGVFYMGGFVAYITGVMSMSVFAEASSASGSAIILLFYACMGILFVCMGIGMVFSICASLALPPAICNTVKNGSFKSAFKFSEWWPVLKANLGGFLIALLLILGMYGVIMVISQILYMTVICCCLMYVVSFIGGYYLSLVVAGLIPLVYKEGLEKLAEQQAV